MSQGKRMRCRFCQLSNDFDCSLRNGRASFRNEGMNWARNWEVLLTCVAPGSPLWKAGAPCRPAVAGAPRRFTRPTNARDENEQTTFGRRSLWTGLGRPAPPCGARPENGRLRDGQGKSTVLALVPA